MNTTHGTRTTLTIVAMILSAMTAYPIAQERTIKDGLLDEIRLRVPKLSGDVIVLVRPFSTDKADLGTGAKGDGGEAKAAKRLQADGPKLLAASLVKELTTLGPFPSVREDSGAAAEKAVIVEGRFTTLDPGSRAKRYFAGFGAGKTVVEIQGTLKDASGAVLADFTQKRIGTMGLGGGDSEDKMTDDAKSIGEDIAEFLSAWAKGKALK